MSRLKSQLSEVDSDAPTVPVKRASEIEQRDYAFATKAEELAAGGARARLVKASVTPASKESKDLTASGEVIEIWNNRRDPALSISRVLVEPGRTADPDDLDIDIRYVVIKGSGSVRIGSRKSTGIAAGYVVAIPAHIQRQITNTDGQGGQDLIYYRICSPRLKPQRRRKHNDPPQGLRRFYFWERIRARGTPIEQLPAGTARASDPDNRPGRPEYPSDWASDPRGGQSWVSAPLKHSASGSAKRG